MSTAEYQLNLREPNKLQADFLNRNVIFQLHSEKQIIYISNISISYTSLTVLQWTDTSMHVLLSQKCKIFKNQTVNTVSCVSGQEIFIQLE